jgi:hypothetical protein
LVQRRDVKHLSTGPKAKFRIDGDGTESVRSSLASLSTTMIVPGASSTLDIELDDAAVLGLDQIRILAVVRHDEAIGVCRSLASLVTLPSLPM